MFQQHVPGARGQNHLGFPNGGHLLQEQGPAALVETILTVAG